MSTFTVSVNADKTELRIAKATIAEERLQRLSVVGSEISAWRVVRESFPSFERTWFIDNPRAEIAGVEKWVQCMEGRSGWIPARLAAGGALDVLGTRLPLWIPIIQDVLKMRSAILV